MWGLRLKVENFHHKKKVITPCRYTHMVKTGVGGSSVGYEVWHEGVGSKGDNHRPGLRFANTRFTTLAPTSPRFVGTSRRSGFSSATVEYTFGARVVRHAVVWSDKLCAVQDLNMHAAIIVVDVCIGGCLLSLDRSIYIRDSAFK